MTLQEAKDKVARKRGYKSFLEMEQDGFGIGTGELLAYADQAAELYCLEERERTWDRACEEQKKIICEYYLNESKTFDEMIFRGPKPEFKP